MELISTSNFSESSQSPKKLMICENSENCPQKEIEKKEEMIVKKEFSVIDSFDKRPLLEEEVEGHESSQDSGFHEEDVTDEKDEPLLSTNSLEDHQAVKGSNLPSTMSTSNVVPHQTSTPLVTQSHQKSTNYSLSIPVQISPQPTFPSFDISFFGAATTISAKMSTAQVAHRASPLMAPRNSYSPSSGDSPVREEQAIDKPLDFSKQSVKTPPCSSGEDEPESKRSPRSGRDLASQIELTKSLAAEYGFPHSFQPKFVKNEHHCFSTPSPSPPERTHHHFGSSLVPPTAELDPASMLNQHHFLGLLSQLAQPHASTPNASQSSHQLAMKQALQLAAATGGVNGSAGTMANQQLALLQALMQAQSLNNHSVGSGLDLNSLAKSLSIEQPMAAHHRPQIPSPHSTAKLASPLAASQPSLVPSGYHHHPASAAFLVSQSQPASAAMSGLSFSTAGANGALPQYNSSSHHHHHSKPSSASPEPTLVPTTGHLVDSTSSYVRANAHHNRTSPNASNQKPVRPFKALYNNKDSFAAQSPFTPSVSIPTVPSVATDSLTTQSLLLANSDNAYQEFRNKMLHSKNGRSSVGSARNGHDQHQMHNSDDNNSVASYNSSDGGQDHESNSSQPAASTGPVLPYVPISTTSTTPPNGSSSTSASLSNSARKRGRPLPEDLKDEAYWERRRKNNEAAKRSRDLRRAKEDEIAIRAAFLEQENFKLKCELVQARLESEKMKTLWLSTQSGQQAAQQQTQLSPNTTTNTTMASQVTPEQFAAMFHLKANSPK